MCDCKRTFGTVMVVPDVQAASRWLCDNLFFTQIHVDVLRNGNCTIYLEQGEPAVPQLPLQGHYYTGLAHVALAAADINKALSHCQQRGLTLQTQNGKSFFNPKVFGEGEWYFNILTPFGATIEIAQRQGSPIVGATEICGLDHLGVPSADFEDEMQSLEMLGFAPLFAPVNNCNQQEGRIVCCMLSDASLTLEVYQFLDMVPHPQPEGTVLRGIGSSYEATTVGGLRFLCKVEVA